MITSQIIADSINPANCRLTTFVLEYPRYIHSETLTHRVFSKNAASSRAIPIEKMIQQIQENPAMPTRWGKNQAGMSANEELDDLDKKHKLESWHEVSYSDKELAMIEWLKARDSAITHVKKLNELNLHKQIANRILEPWFHIRIVLSGTDFENFFALRVHKDAHPDLQKLAGLMLDQYNVSEPQSIASGGWHIPFGDKMDEDKINGLSHLIPQEKRGGLFGNLDEFDKQEFKKKIAIARCARISYLNYEGKDDYEADIKLCDRLFKNTPKHLSPTEHIAQSCSDSARFGNFAGWKQYRYFSATKI